MQVTNSLLQNIHHDRDETICRFSTHLLTQARICKFLVKYPGSITKIGYTENILHNNVLTYGLANSEIQMDLLGDQNQDMTLQEEFLFVEAKEVGK